MRCLHHVVVQGSVLGSLHFLLYTSPLSDIIHKHNGNSFRCCADNSQIYMTPSRKTAWPSGQRIGLAIRRSRVRIPLWVPFLESPIINGPVNLLLFTCKIEVTTVLYLT